MERAERMWFVLAPEGTRRKVENWKTGFWKIARRAQVPVFTVGFNYPDRTIRLGQLVTLSDDMDADLRRIRAMFADYRGKHRDA
jgi:1-acyl-sn-glycerol-3-phosphate acyltransferase